MPSDTPDRALVPADPADIPDDFAPVEDLPQLHGGRSHELTDKQKLWIKYVSMGIPPTEAARKAGYKNPAQSAFLNRRSPFLVMKNRELLAKVGVTEEYLFEKIFEGLNATRTYVQRVEGENGRSRTETITEPDFHARHKFLQHASVLMGVVPESAPVRVDVKSGTGAPASIAGEGDDGGANVSITVNEGPRLITNEILNLTGKDLQEALMRRARQIINGTLPKEQYGGPLKIEAKEIRGDDA